MFVGDHDVCRAMVPHLVHGRGSPAGSTGSGMPLAGRQTLVNPTYSRASKKDTSLSTLYSVSFWAQTRRTATTTQVHFETNLQQMPHPNNVTNFSMGAAVYRPRYYRRGNKSLWMTKAPSKWITVLLRFKIWPFTGHEHIAIYNTHTLKLCVLGEPTS